MSEEIIEYISSVTELLLVPSAGGVFTVQVNGNTVFDKKKTGRFPNKGEAKELVKAARV